MPNRPLFGRPREEDVSMRLPQGCGGVSGKAKYARTAASYGLKASVEIAGKPFGIAHEEARFLSSPADACV